LNPATIDEFWIAWVEVVDYAAPFEADLSKQRPRRDVAAIGGGKYFWSMADRDQITEKHLSDSLYGALLDLQKPMR
jgi:hypothetical protein